MERVSIGIVAGVSGEEANGRAGVGEKSAKRGPEGADGGKEVSEGIEGCMGPVRCCAHHLELRWMVEYVVVVGGEDADG